MYVLEIKYLMLCPFIIIILHGQMKGMVSSISVTQTNFNGAILTQNLLGERKENGHRSSFSRYQEVSVLLPMLKGQVCRHPLKIS